MKGRDWITADNGVSYFPCVCGECVETMGEYYAHMDFCMTEKRQIFLETKAAAEKAKRTIDLLDDGDPSWNSPAMGVRTGD